MRRRPLPPFAHILEEHRGYVSLRLLLRDDWKLIEQAKPLMLLLANNH